MNNKLIRALKDGDQELILKILAESKVAESEVADMLAEEDTARAIAESVKIACNYITVGAGSVSKTDPNWATYVNAAVIQVGLEKIQDNPATPLFVQAMMLIAYALLKGD